MAMKPTELSQMPRFAELATLAKARHPKDVYFDGLENSVRLSNLARAQCWAYERAFATVDAESWKVLRDKAIAHFTDHRKGQWKQGFFNQLNEAFAYRLLQRCGYRGVKILPETGKKTPDIAYKEGAQRRCCEVKTISISDAAIQRRGSGVAYNTGAVYHELPPAFMAKLISALNAATDQIKAGCGIGLIFLDIHFDDITLANYQRYRRQMVACLATHPAENVYVKIGTVGHKFLVKGPIGRTRRRT